MLAVGLAAASVDPSRALVTHKAHSNVGREFTFVLRKMNHTVIAMYSKMQESGILQVGMKLQREKSSIVIQYVCLGFSPCTSSGQTYRA